MTHFDSANMHIYESIKIVLINFYDKFDKEPQVLEHT